MSIPAVRIEAIQMSVLGKEVRLDLQIGGKWHDGVIRFYTNSEKVTELLDAEKIRARTKKSIAPTAFNGNCADSGERTGTLTRIGG